MRNGVFAAALVALGLIGLGTWSAAAEENGPNPNDGPYPETTLILELQAAIRNDDKDWFVSHLHYPVRYFGKKTKHIIHSKDWFISHYDTVIGLALKENILAQDPEHFFKNYQGLMVGDGGLNVWFEDFGDPGDGIPSRFEIITINNSD